jgi:hypothetical protein
VIGSRTCNNWRMTFLALLFLMAGVLVAQPSHVYAVAGLGSYSGKVTSQYALGGEWVAGRRFGVGGELGVLAGHNSFGFLNANGYYHLKTASRKLDPFVTGGVGTTLDPFGSSELLMNFGGGANYWFHRRLGLRVELRDLIGAGNSPASSHLWGLRVGLALH